MSEKFTFVINTYKKLIQKIYFSVFLVTSDGNDERYQDVKATIDTIEDNKIKIEMTTESDNMFLLNRNNYRDYDDFYRVYYDHIEIMDLVQTHLLLNWGLLTRIKIHYQDDSKLLPALLLFLILILQCMGWKILLYIQQESLCMQYTTNNYNHKNSPVFKIASS